MKELSIEEKAKAYDKAIERTKEMIKDMTNNGGVAKVDDIQYLFPALKDSEDERIKKVIYGWIYTQPSQLFDNGFSKEEMLTWLEKQGEQKPADKVEPKFRNGQWIVWQDKCYKVNYNGCGYELVDQDGLSTSLEYGTIDENAHRWTIQDAKPGDIIYLPNGNNEYYFFIFKGIENAAVMSFAHFYKYNDGTYKVEGTKDKQFSVNDVFRPATKEQREQLLKAISDAGFAWDAEKKELKKVEQSSAWSEEDELVALSIEQVMNCASVLNIVPDKIDKIRAWLKSLKERYTWKPSDEQIDILDVVLTNESMDDNIARILRELREQLKNLKGE